MLHKILSNGVPVIAILGIAFVVIFGIILTAYRDANREVQPNTIRDWGVVINSTFEVKKVWVETSLGDSDASMNEDGYYRTDHYTRIEGSMGNVLVPGNHAVTKESQIRLAKDQYGGSWVSWEKQQWVIYQK
jgi:hypothetical protein